MATLYLKQAWLNILDTGVGFSFYTDSGKNHTRGINGRVQVYAAGNTRAISSKGVKGTFSFTMRRVTQLEVDLVESWFGQAVVYRDNRSRAIFGVIFDHSVTDNSHRDYYTVSVTLNQVTYVEGI